MRIPSPILALLLFMLSVIGCGGGSTPAPSQDIQTVSGFAATGMAIRGGEITLRDAAGHVATSSTDSSGYYEIGFDGTWVGPFLLKVHDPAQGDVFFTYAAEKGTANIHPFTNLIVQNLLAQAGHDNTDALFLQSGTIMIPARNQVEAVTDNITRLIAGQMEAAGLSAGYDVFAGTLEPGSGSGFDNVLDALKVSIAADGAVAISQATETGNPIPFSNFRLDASAPVVSFSGTPEARRIAAGDWATVVVKDDGTVWAWGLNLDGRLGDNSVQTRLTPVQVPGLSNVRSVVAGGDNGSVGHTIAVKVDGTVWAWGCNQWGELGDNTTTNRLMPVQVPGLTGVVAATAGFGNSAALKDDGTVWTWGCYGWGETVNNATVARKTPVQVPGLAEIVALSTSWDEPYALKSDGTIWTWSWAPYASQPTASLVAGLNGIVALRFTNNSAILVLRNDGTVWKSEFGSGGLFTQVQGLSDVVSIAGGIVQNIALRSDGTVWTIESTPVQVPGLSGIVAVSVGYDHAVALRADGTVWSWIGYPFGNSYGALGNDSIADNTTPVQAITSVADPFQLWL